MNDEVRWESAYVGRTVDIEALERLLQEHRLVTVTGLTGIGKSRLAAEFAARCGERFGEGAFFVDLSPLGDAAQIAPTIATLLRPGVPVDSTDADSLAEAVGERTLLLVVDNCERAIDPTARVISTFLDVCPNVRVLATCREPLDVRGEYVYTLGPLSTDETLELFAQRAAIAGNTARAREVGAGVPLAVELIAARATDDDLERFAAWNLPAAAAAQSAVEWSYERGDEQERRIFRALAVFAGGFTLEAAADLGTHAKGSRDATLTVLARLERAALIERSGNRYRMLEPARAFATERLRESGEFERMARRHAEVIEALARRAHDRELDMTREAWRALLEHELANVRTALVWSLDKGNDPALGAGIIGNLGVFWREAGVPVEGLRRAQQAGALGEGDGWLWLAISAIKSALWIHPREQLDAAERAETLFESAGDTRGRAMALVRQGRAYAFMRKYDTAKGILQRAERLAREYGVGRLITHVLYEASVAAGQCDDFVEAKRLYAAVIPKLREEGERRLLAVALSNNAEVEFATGDPGRAIECLNELAEFQTKDLNQGMFEGNKTAYLVALDRRTEAIETGRAALRVMRLSEDRVRIVFLLQHLAAAYALEGDLLRAARLFGYTDAQYSAFDIDLEFTERYTQNLLVSAVREGLGRDQLEELVHEGSLYSAQDAADEALRA